MNPIRSKKSEISADSLGASRTSNGMKDYDPKEIEAKWQKKWEKSGIYKAEDNSDKPKYYTLIEFPYPSGDGLHVGHPRPYIGLDIVSRKRRMQGYNVLYPIGWDAFGLPTENFAIKTGKDPKVVTKENTDTFRRQIQSLGISFDWSREINTTDPKYYKWKQWIFLKLLEHGLAYKAKIPVNWCPKDKIVLANEEVVNGCCERCGTPVEQKEKEQWMLAITKYADKLLSGLETVDYPERVKVQQRNWIGKSDGMLFTAPVKDTDLTIQTFSAHFEAFAADTFVVIAPDHPFLKTLIKGTSTEEEVLDFAEKLTKERMAEGYNDKEPKGIFTGRYIVDPVGNGDLPIWVASYALADYGTGIVKCSAHDERDYIFAKKYNIPLKEVLIPRTIDKNDPPREGVKTVERKAVQVVVINPKDDKVLALRWKKFPWTTFVTGGIDEGEDVIDAARREILEETGYKNVKFIRHLGSPIESHFYANHKEENRKALFYDMVFELEDEERVKMSDEEKEIHEVVWMSWDEIEADPNTKSSEYDILKDRFFNPPHAWTDMKNSVLTEPSEFAGKVAGEVRTEIMDYLEKTGIAKRVTTYKLRDWVFSRQRYWGEPIPVVHCDKCGIVPVPEKDLPVRLPEVENYQPTDTGESPLSNIKEFVDTECPQCGSPAKRETDTMPNWAGSSWYFLRYTDPENDQALADKKKLEYWMPVDWYNGGMEHTVLHLLYSRFWNKFLYDIGVVPVDAPYKKRTSHGLILAEGGEKMSKSKGNVINPDTIVDRFGADTLRLYEMFMGPFEQAIQWNESSLVGPRRFLEKVWRLKFKIQEQKGKTLGTDSQGLALMHSTIKKVSEDIEVLGFNTAVSTLMIFTNGLDKNSDVSLLDYETLLKLLAPFAPHITEELWHELGYTNSIHEESWPEYDESKLVSEKVTIVAQVNGKVRGSFEVGKLVSEKEILEKAKSLPEIQKWIGDKNVHKTIFVSGKLVNFVIN
ncbi:MAG: class I tRNA ligase family protein [Patescibacteria group bacterium]